MVFEDDKVYTVAEIAKTIRVTTRTVVAWINNGSLAAMKVGRGWRVQGKEVNDFIAKETEKAVER